LLFSNGVNSLVIQSRQNAADGTTWVGPVAHKLQDLLQLEIVPRPREPSLVCYCEDAHAFFYLSIVINIYG
jgi:hypothetical protein